MARYQGFFTNSKYSKTIADFLLDRKWRNLPIFCCKWQILLHWGQPTNRTHNSYICKFIPWFPKNFLFLWYLLDSFPRYKHSGSQFHRRKQLRIRRYRVYRLLRRRLTETRKRQKQPHICEMHSHPNQPRLHIVWTRNWNMPEMQHLKTLCL